MLRWLLAQFRGDRGSQRQESVPSLAETPVQRPAKVVAAADSEMPRPGRARKATPKKEYPDPGDWAPPPDGQHLRPPRKRGRTPDQQAADLARFGAELARRARASFERDRANAHRAGSVAYRWRSCGDADVCGRCKRNNGKRFSWATEPAGGHPGCGTCDTGEHCRCYAEAILPR